MMPSSGSRDQVPDVSLTVSLGHVSGSSKALWTRRRRRSSANTRPCEFRSARARTLWVRLARWVRSERMLANLGLTLVFNRYHMW